MDVLEADDEGARPGERLEQLADRPERLLACRARPGGTQRAEDSLQHELGVGRAFECGSDRALAARLANNLSEGPERDSIAVGKAPAGEERRPISRCCGELASEPRLPKPGRAEHGEEAARALRLDPLERLEQEGELPLPADEGRVEGARDSGRRAIHLVKPPGRDPVALALDLERADGIRPHRALDEPVRRVADQRPAGFCRLLEPLRHVHDVAGDDRLARPGIAGDDLAGVDPDPDRELHAPGLRQLLVEPREARLHLGRGPNGPEGVVLVRRRDAEDGHHRVADELLDGAAVRLERGAHLLEVARHDSADGLGVDPLAASGGVDDVAEEDGHGLARRARCARRLREGGAARVHFAQATTHRV